MPKSSIAIRTPNSWSRSRLSVAITLSETSMRSVISSIRSAAGKPVSRKMSQ